MNPTTLSKTIRELLVTASICATDSNSYEKALRAVPELRQLLLENASLIADSLEDKEVNFLKYDSAVRSMGSVATLAIRMTTKDIKSLEAALKQIMSIADKILPAINPQQAITTQQENKG